MEHQHFFHLKSSWKAQKTITSNDSQVDSNFHNWVKILTILYTHIDKPTHACMDECANKKKSDHKNINKHKNNQAKFLKKKKILTKISKVKAWHALVWKTPLICIVSKRGKVPTKGVNHEK